MKIILRKDIPKLGYANDIITVKAGYANNYLIPSGWAEVANTGNKKRVAEIIRQTRHKEEKANTKAQHLAEALKVTEVLIPVKLSKEGKVFGKVSSSHIANVLQEKGYEISDHQIEILDLIKKAGAYPIKINLYKNIQVELMIFVQEEKK